MSDPPGEDHVRVNSEISGHPPQVALFWAAADEKDSEVWLSLTQHREGTQQQMQALIEVKRAEKREDGFPNQAEPPRKSRSRTPGPAKASRSTALGMTVIFSSGMPRVIISSRRP